MIVSGCGSGDNGSGADNSLPLSPRVPNEYTALYAELSQTMDNFEKVLDSQWDGHKGSGKFAAALSQANGNSTIGLLRSQSWSNIIAMLDTYQAMGVELIKLEIQYPILTPGFHSYLSAHPPEGMSSYDATVDNFIGYPNSFYNKLTREIRSRGMAIWVEHGTIFSAFTPTPPDDYFQTMRDQGIDACRLRHRIERAAEAVLIATEIQPDYLTLITEPETQNANFGFFNENGGLVKLYDVEDWVAYVRYAAGEVLNAVSGTPLKLGAGSGTWDTRVFIERFAALDELDYIDMHIYPLKSLYANYLENVLQWDAYVKSIDPDKFCMIGEAWLWKASAQEVSSNIFTYLAYSRDVYSFWQPLDIQFLEILYKLMHAMDMGGVMPFWVAYYFSYLEYGTIPEDLSPVEIINYAGRQSLQNMKSGLRTATGDRFEEIINR